MPHRITIQSTTPDVDRAIQRGVRSSKQIKVEQTRRYVRVTFMLEQVGSAKKKPKKAAHSHAKSQIHAAVG